MGLTSGTKLGPYEIVSPLGAGGMGEVYRARDTRLERDVAIKVLPPNLSSDSSLRQRLEREAKAVSKLSHPHICTLHDIGHQDGVDFLVMELVEGETLEHRLLKGPLPAEQENGRKRELTEPMRLLTPAIPPVRGRTGRGSSQSSLGPPAESISSVIWPSPPLRVGQNRIRGPVERRYTGIRVIVLDLEAGLTLISGGVRIPI
jgi:hypothetical protein